MPIAPLVLPKEIALRASERPKLNEIMSMALSLSAIGGPDLQASTDFGRDRKK